VCNLCMHAGGDRRSRGLSGFGASGNALASRSEHVTSAIFADGATMQQKAAQGAAMETLKTIYKGKIKPLEDAFMFSKFYQSEVSDGDFNAKV
jgi:hypothetical protein